MMEKLTQKFSLAKECGFKGYGSVFRLNCLFLLTEKVKFHSAPEKLKTVFPYLLRRGTNEP